MSNQYRRTIVIGMDYSEFSGGITEINRKMGLLDAEFRRATAEATLYGNETDKLGVKQEVLRQKIELQKKKIEESTKAYERTVAANGQMSRATDQASRALTNEETALLRLQLELNQTEDRMRDLGDQSDDAGNQISEAGEHIGDTAELLEGATEESRTFGDTLRDVADFIGLEANPVVEKFAEKFDGVDENIGKAVLTIGSLTTALGSLTLKTADQAKEIENASQKMGMNTDQYQEWDYVMKMVGSDAESMTGDIAALAEKALEATDKTSDTAKTFRKLGVNVRDSHGALKSQNQLFNEVVLGLQKMTNETERNAVASDLLSTTGENIVPVLNMTKEELKGLRKEAHDTGYVIGEESVEEFSKLKDSMNELEGVGEGLSNSFAAALLPIFTELLAVVTAIPTPVLSMIITLAGTIAAMYSVGKATSKAMDGIDGLRTLFGGLDAKTIRTTAIVMGVVAALIALAAIVAVIMGQGDNLSRSMDSVGNSVGKISKGVQNTQSKTQYYASGTNYAPGGEAWVGEHGPEKVILPTGAQVLNSEASKRSGGDTYILNATINAKDVKEWNDVINFMQQTKPAVRAGRSML